MGILHYRTGAAHERIDGAPYRFKNFFGRRGVVIAERGEHTFYAEQFVFGVLLGMEAEPPFSLYYQGDWQYGIVRPMQFPKQLPVSYDCVLDQINNFESYLHEDLRYRSLKVPEQFIEVTSRLFFFFLSCFPDGRYPKLTRPQEDAMAAAFTLMGLGALSDTSIKPDVLLEVFRVSERRLENAMKRIFITMQREKES